MIFTICNRDLMDLDRSIRHLNDCLSVCDDYDDDYYVSGYDEHNMLCTVPYGYDCRVIPYVNADWLNFNIRKVIFNNPATIVFWEDGTKTVTKCQEGDEYNKEFGLMACILKYLTGNNGRWNEIIKDWVKDEEEEKE